MDLDSLYRDLVEESPDGLWVTDLHGRTIYANAAFARLYGVPLDEITSVTVFDTLDATGQVQFADHLRRVRAGHPNQEDVEVLFQDVHGRATWISLRESVLRREGKPFVIVNRIYSYDNRRRVLDELRASREALREAQDLARLGTWVYDIATGAVEPMGGAHLLAPGADVTSISDFLDLVHPEDRDAIAQRAAEILQRPGQFEADVRVSGDGDWVHLRVRGVVQTSPDGTPVRVTGTHQDITAMRLAEVALRDEVVQSALMRKVAAAANGAHSLREIMGVVRPLLLDHDEWYRASGFGIDGDGDLVSIDVEVRAEDERLAREAVAQRATVWSDDGCTVAFHVSTEDRTFGVGTITASVPPQRRDMVEVMVESVGVQLARVAEREESGRALASARDAAMAASRQKSEFLTTMSHEIRTPLNGIIGLTDLLQRTSLDHDQHRLISGMQAASHSLLSVLNDVLDFSKLDGRPVELEHVDVDVRSLIDQVTRVLSGSARTGGVELVTWCEADVPAVVLGDPTRLSQVLMNLASNAVKFSTDGQVLLRVSCPDDEEDRVLLRFDVVDTGIGIEPEHLERLFEPFTQADASTTRRFGGTGLGLSIAREVTAALDGDLTYAPNPGGGSIFTLSVWCERHPEGVTDLDEYARQWLDGRRVLVADGSSLRASALQDQLRWWGAQVDVADDVAAANALLAASLTDQQPYGAVLVDAGLPGGGGMHLVGDIAGDTAYDEVAMVVLGADREVDTDELRDAGVSVFLERPVTVETLRSALLEQVVGVAPEPLGRADLPAESAHLARILVVEDNVVNQLVARGILVSLGYRPEVAQNGAEALELLARESYDAVLMDVQMPVLDGYAATRTLRERESAGAHVPVIAMTAAAVDGERERCLAAGMDEFLTKPIDRPALIEVLERWLGPRKEVRPRVDADPDEHGPTDLGPDDHEDPVPLLPPTDPIEGLDTERLDMLRDLDPGDTSYIDRAIGNFQKNSSLAESEIGEHVTRQDLAGLKSAAHKIAGSALNLGAPRAGEAARALEQLADTGSIEGVGDLMGELHASMEEARRLLLQYQATYSS